MIGQWTEGFGESHVDKTGWKEALKRTFSLQGAKSRRDKNNQALFTLPRHLLGMSLKNKES